MRGVPSRCGAAAGIFLLLALPASAHAHGAFPGVEGIISGLLHPVTTPAHVLIMLSLGMMVGQRAPLELRTPFTVFAPALTAALLLTLIKDIPAVPPVLLLGTALAGAGLVALEKSPPAWLVRALFAVAALGLGLDSRVDTGSTATILKTLLGTWLMIHFLVFDAAYYTSLAVRKPWLRTGVRVLGSWIVAIALLMLAFILKKAG